MAHICFKQQRPPPDLQIARSTKGIQCPPSVPVWHGCGGKVEQQQTASLTAAPINKSVHEHLKPALEGFMWQVWTHLAHKLHDLI